MRWEHLVPEGWTSKDGRSVHDMSLAERNLELATNPSLKRLLPKSWRDSRATLLRECRKDRFLQGPWPPLVAREPTETLRSAT